MTTRRDSEPKKKPNRFGFVNHGGSKPGKLGDKFLADFEEGKGKP